MTKENQNVEQLPEAISMQTVKETIGFEVSKIRLYFRANKVSVTCRYNQHSFGSKGQTLKEALYDINQRIRLDIQLAN